MEQHHDSIAAIQLSSGADVQANLAVAARLLDAAADAGARLAALPENFALMGARATDKLALAEPDGDGPIQRFLADRARALQMWIIAGTVPLRLTEDPQRVAPACLVYDGHGQRVARYDKIHLFDVWLPQYDSERYQESATLAPGSPAPCCVDTPVGRVGLSVCYDVRFPELYRRLVADGAEILCVPAAFTARTGRAHWDLLLRTRALENQCWLLAPAQCGTHPDGRATWGNSLIVDPWGEVLARQSDGAGVITARVPRARLEQVRTRFPALRHRRL